MAIVKFVTAGCPLNNIFPYVMNREKTDERLITGIHCMPESAFHEFLSVKEKYRKNDGRQYYHIIQSFSPDDPVTAATVHEIGLKFAEYFPGYQILIATHRDKSHIHNHLILNSVNMENGRKFHMTRDEMLAAKEFSNRLCREYGLSQTEARSGFSGMPAWKKRLREDAFRALCRSRYRAEFIEEMENHGYGIKWEKGYKYITFTTPDGHKCRDNKLFCEQLLRKNLEAYFILGGCDSELAQAYRSYRTSIGNEKQSYTVTAGLWNLLCQALSVIPPDPACRYTPTELSETDKDRIMELEALGMVKIQPKAFVYYSTDEEYAHSQGFSM